MSVRFALLVAAAAVGCSAPLDSSAPPAETESATTVTPSHWVDEATGSEYLLNHERRVVYESQKVQRSTDGVARAVQALNASGVMTVTPFSTAVQVVECSTPYGSGKLSAGCTVDPEYVLVGGGAEDTWMYTPNSPGALLTESRPKDADDYGDGRTWLGASKDHYYPASRTLHVWAVGLRLSDQVTGAWLPASTTKKFIHYQSATGSPSLLPTARCTVGGGRLILGGGARSNLNLQPLTGSYFESTTTGQDSWVAASKAHLYAESAAVTAYCISIASITSAGIAKRFVSSASHTTTARWDAVEAPIDRNGVVPTCFGGRATYADAGRMLYRISPQDETITRSVAGSKDHGVYDGGTTTTQLLLLRIEH